MTHDLRTRMHRYGAVLVLVSVIAAGCVSADSGAQGTTVPPAPTTIELVHHDLARGGSIGAAREMGTLNLQSSRCLVLKSDYSDLAFLMLWPPGYSAVEQDGLVTVINDLGEPVGTTGELLPFGGSSADRDFAAEKAEKGGDELPDCAVDLYWLTSW